MSIFQESGTGRAGDPLVRTAHSFGHPDQVLYDQELTLADKRAVLASWASDALAVEDRPLLRQLPSGAIVSVGDILAALKSVDLKGGDAIISFSKSFARRRVNPSLRRRGLRPDDDDDPSPLAGRAAIPLTRQILTKVTRLRGL